MEYPFLEFMKKKPNTNLTVFEKRKIDHIQLALDPQNQAQNYSGLEHIQLLHNALPEINFDAISLTTKTLNKTIKNPFLVSSMTAGHIRANKINQRLAKACELRGWAMGVGSQRRELIAPQEKASWASLRRLAPHILLFGNIGLSQLIRSKTTDIQRLVDALEADAMIIHCNPLQECLQPEGTPFFKGGIAAIKKLCKTLSVPVIVKETGCGFSANTLRQLNELPIAAVDISGLGGTHWGRIEGARSPYQHTLAKSAKTFHDWGISTVDAMHAAIEVKPHYEIWASGGVRSGLDAAKLIAMGAVLVGYAKPLLGAALKGLNELLALMDTYEYELKISLFCTGNTTIKRFKESHVWRLKTM